jgi:hypothetical protein
MLGFHTVFVANFRSVNRDYSSAVNFNVPFPKI